MIFFKTPLILAVSSYNSKASLLTPIFYYQNMISNGRTEWSTIRSVIIRVIGRSDLKAGVQFICPENDYGPNWTTRSLIAKESVHKNFNFREETNIQVMKERKNCHNFDCDWLIECPITNCLITTCQVN